MPTKVLLKTLTPFTMQAIEKATSSPATWKGVLGLESSAWMMAPSERLAVIGLISLLEPKRVLELGCAKGGLTHWLAQLTPEVTTVDLDIHVHRVCEHSMNLTAMCMTTEKALGELTHQEKHFDLAIIDADHSMEGAKRDLTAVLALADVVLLHDTFNPACRSGYRQALADKDVYANLDLVEGGLQPDGLWGGLGIVINDLPRSSRLFVTQRRSVYPSLRRRYQFQILRQQMMQFPARLRSRIGTLLRGNDV